MFAITALVRRILSQVRKLHTASSPRDEMRKQTSV